MNTYLVIVNNIRDWNKFVRKVNGIESRTTRTCRTSDAEYVYITPHNNSEMIRGIALSGIYVYATDSNKLEDLIYMVTHQLAYTRGRIYRFKSNILD